MEISWYKAIILKERIKSLLESNGELQQEGFNQQQAEKRLKQWRSRSQFKDDNYFNKRLTAAGIDEKLFLYLLGESIEDLFERTSVTPTWISELITASNNITHNNRQNNKEALNKSNEVTLENFVAALNVIIKPRRAKVLEQARQLAMQAEYIIFEPVEIEEVLFQVFLKRTCSQLIFRTVATKLAESREQGLLKGDTPQARYKFFIDQISQPENVFKLLAEFPVLARQIIIHVDNWVKHSIELLKRLTDDWPQIHGQLFSGKDVGRLVAVKLLGDDHRSGTVMKLDFSNNYQLIYKPKSLAVDLHFQQLLDWLNQQGHKPEFKTVNIINCGEYGWSEYLTAQPCSSNEEIIRFYQRQGNNLALLFALRATDIHDENVIAVGEYPIIIDLEMLFRQLIPINTKENCFGLATNFIDNSVMAIGLLPNRVHGNEKYIGVDYSGLGGEVGQFQPVGQVWQNEGTDELRLEYQPIELDNPNDNLPRLNGKVVNAKNYLTEIVSGFTTTYRLIIEVRERLLAANSILSCFRNDPIRVIARPTAVYARLLLESFHPSMLRNALPRDWLFDYLWLDRKAIDFRISKIVVNTELDDMQEGYVPIFYTSPESIDLITSTGIRIPDCFPEPAMESVRQQIASFSEQQLTEQQWFIKASFAGMAGEKLYDKSNLWLDYQYSSHSTIEPVESFLPEGYRNCLIRSAQAIGDKLLDIALLKSDFATWITLHFSQNGNYRFGNVNMDLYDGIYGIALFLAYLGKLSNSDRYTELARAALRSAQQTQLKRSSLKSVGGFSGWGSVIYALTHLAILWNDDELMSEAVKIVQKLKPLIEQDKSFDIISGAAGCILPLLNLHQFVPSREILLTAIQCGDHLLATSQPQAEGIGWITIEGRPPLTGFSHGNAGIAWALAKLAKATGETRFDSTAQSALDYETSLFSVPAGNWRYTGATNLTQETFVTAWCYGAPGIGLSRLQLLTDSNNKNLQKDFDVALKTTLASGFSINSSICHGWLGNLELILQASEKGRKFTDLDISTQLNIITNRLLKTIDRSGIEILTVSPYGIELPGLMTGMSGAGYQLMRLAAPDEVPSVLILAPPIK